MEKEGEMKKETRQLLIDELLSLLPPQKGRFIGAFDLCVNYEAWKGYSCEEMEVGFKTTEEERNAFFKDFEDNVKGEIVHGWQLLEDSDPEEFQIDDRFEMEKVYPFSTLRKTALDRPDPKFTHFMILPVDYNRGGDDIGVAWLTKKGKLYYSQYLTGDY